MSIGKRIKELRKAKGITQKELATLTGFSFSLISKLESGEKENPEYKTIKRIADTLGTTLKDLLTEPTGTLGDKIREARKKQGLKQEELSKLTGLSRVSIGNYERNDRTPDINTANKIAIALNIPIQSLIATAPVLILTTDFIINNTEYPLEQAIECIKEIVTGCDTICLWDSLIEIKTSNIEVRAVKEISCTSIKLCLDNVEIKLLPNTKYVINFVGNGIVKIEREI